MTKPMNPDWNGLDADKIWELTQESTPWTPNPDQAWVKVSSQIAGTTAGGDADSTVGSKAAAHAHSASTGLGSSDLTGVSLAGGAKLLGLIAVATGAAALYYGMFHDAATIQKPQSESVAAEQPTLSSSNPGLSSASPSSPTEALSARPVESLGKPGASELKPATVSSEAVKSPREMVEKPAPVTPVSPDNKILRFRQTELRVVAEILTQTYGVEIRIENPELQSCKLTATFANETLKTVLEIIQETFNLEVVPDGEAQVLKGGICQ